MPRKTHNPMIIRIKQRRLLLYFSQDRRRYIAINGGGGGSRTRVPTRSNEDFYMLISSLLFFVLCRSRWTGLTPDYSFLWSHLKPKDDCFRLERWMTPWPPSTPQGRQRGREIRLPMRTVRSQLSFWPMFYEANDHPRHAINTQPGRSNPEHPRWFNIV